MPKIMFSQPHPGWFHICRMGVNGRVSTTLLVIAASHRKSKCRAWDYMSTRCRIDRDRLLSAGGYHKAPPLIVRAKENERSKMAASPLVHNKDALSAWLDEGRGQKFQLKSAQPPQGLWRSCCIPFVDLAHHLWTEGLSIDGAASW